MIVMKRVAVSEFADKNLWLLRLPTAPTTMRNLARAHTLIGKIEGLEPARKTDVLASLDKTDEQFQTTVARVTAKLKAQGMSAMLNTAPVWSGEIPRDMAFETPTDVLNKNVTIYQDALALLGPKTALIDEELQRVSGLRPSASSEQNFSESDMQSQMEAFLRRRESERPARSWFSRMGSRIGSFLSMCVSFCRRTPVTDPISLQATELIRASTEAFRAGFGEKNTLIFTERLKGLNISDQLSTLNSEYANPAQKEAVKSALTELVHYHIEQGTGEAFTSATIKVQISKERAVHDRDKGEFLRNDSLGSLAFSTFANAVGGDCLIPIKEKMEAIGNAERMAIHLDQAALIEATTEVFDTVATLDHRMPESLKAVLRDVITDAGDEGKTAFNSTFFLRFLVPFLSVSGAANSPNNESNKIIAAVLQKTANAWSRGETTVSFRESARKFLEKLASQRIGEIDTLIGRIKDDGGRLSEVSYPVGGGGASSRRSDDTDASSEADRNLDSEHKTGLGSPAQSVHGNFCDGPYAPPTLFSSGVLARDYFDSGPSEGASTERSLAPLFDKALSDPEQRDVPQLTSSLNSGPGIHPSGGGAASPIISLEKTKAKLPKVAKTPSPSREYKAATKKINDCIHKSFEEFWPRRSLESKLHRLKGSADLSDKENERLGAHITDNLTRSREYIAGINKINHCTDKYWADQCLESKLQEVLASIVLSTKEQRLLRAHIRDNLTDSRAAEKTFKELCAQEDKGSSRSPTKVSGAKKK